MEKQFCGACYKFVDYNIAIVEKTVHFSDMDVTVLVKEVRCAECNNVMDIEKITRENDTIIYAARDEKERKKDLI